MDDGDGWKATQMYPVPPKYALQHGYNCKLCNLCFITIKMGGNPACSLEAALTGSYCWNPGQTGAHRTVLLMQLGERKKSECKVI